MILRFRISSKFGPGGCVNQGNAPLLHSPAIGGLGWESGEVLTHMSDAPVSLPLVSRLPPHHPIIMSYLFYSMVPGFPKGKQKPFKG